jgi:transcriptional regulator with XRE-family HTH domain
MQMHDTNRLSVIMYENGITYRELSRKSGVSKSALNKIANFEEDPTQSTMISIARALQMNVTDVFFLDWREYYGD